MWDNSIIARRLESGKYVQYGWSGNVGYFYDTDNRWYYIIPGSFRIKLPLEYLRKHFDERNREYDTLILISRDIVRQIFIGFAGSNEKLRELLKDEYCKTSEDIMTELLAECFPLSALYNKYIQII